MQLSQKRKDKLQLVVIHKTTNHEIKILLNFCLITKHGPIRKNWSNGVLLF